MTSGNVNNFVSDLVLMAKAMEELPHVQQALTASEAEANRLAASVQAREESILRLKAEIEALQAKVRNTEAERDDAELRFLDADDKAHKVTSILRAALGEVGDAVVILDPPKPEPVPTPQAEPEVKHEEAAPIPVEQSPYYNAAAQGQSASGPTLGNTPESPAATNQDTGSSSPSPLPVTSFEEVPKSDANPSQDTASAQPNDSGSAVPYSGASTTENVSVSTTTESADDVGYHNEPDVGTDWAAWNVWCERMRQRYGVGAWPQRPDNAAPSVA